MTDRPHSTHVVGAGNGFWRWNCRCSEKVRVRWPSRALAEAAGIAHEEAKNGTKPGQPGEMTVPPLGDPLADPDHGLPVTAVPSAP